jgi:hypothetical protein
MKKTNHAEQLNYLQIENVLLRAQVNALTDVFANHYLAYGTYSRESFDSILIDPRKKEHLRRFLGLNRYLTDEQKIEVLKSVQP